MSDSPENARQPLRPWQYILVVTIVAATVLIMWFFLRGGELWHRTPTKPVERAGGGAVPAFIGPPDQQEAAAKQYHQPEEKQQAAVDESLEFNSPLTPMNVQPASGFVRTADQRPIDASLAGQGGPSMANSSLFTANAVAYRVPHPTYTIRKGTLIPCTDVTAIDTSSGGVVGVSATLPHDVWSMDHHMILLPKGTTVAGEVGHGLVNGLDRIGVAWREFTTPPPDSVGVSILSPATGGLGEGGLDGDINRHEWQKIKGILALSLLQGGLATLQSSMQSQGSTNINFSSFSQGGNEIGNTLLQSSISIPDTIHRDQGLTCGIFMAQDVDFSKVYSARIVK